MIAMTKTFIHMAELAAFAAASAAEAAAPAESATAAVILAAALVASAAALEASAADFAAASLPSSMPNNIFEIFHALAQVKESQNPFADAEFAKTTIQTASAVTRHEGVVRSSWQLNSCRRYRFEGS